MNKYMPYFKSSILVLVLGLFLSAFVGYEFAINGDGSVNMSSAIFQAVLACLILTILEISISFENAVVNASVLKDMDEVWQKRFLTWGMLIAVFGMRLVFPVLILSVVAKMSPWAALMLAIQSPKEYETIMQSVHHEVAAFGGVFLLMVAFDFFFDSEKEIHWIHSIERHLGTIGKYKWFSYVLTLVALLTAAHFSGPEKQIEVIIAGICGLGVFLALHMLSHYLEQKDIAHPTPGAVAKSGLSLFLYLEVLDASFSFDGVIGAFAITNNLFLIMIGLGVGAMFVRSLTLMMVDLGTLNTLKYIEHGAFYAVLSLGTLMMVGTVVHVSELITGLLGATFIGLSIFSSNPKPLR